MYVIGKVYIWQNLKGEMAYLNGSETIVMEAPKLYGLQRVPRQRTDTRHPTYPKLFALADKGDLRLKEPPTGELSILELFKQLQLEPA